VLIPLEKYKLLTDSRVVQDGSVNIPWPRFKLSPYTLIVNGPEHNPAGLAFPAVKTPKKLHAIIY
jgi:hypothetical protein